jgi:hypothetical protein
MRFLLVVFACLMALLPALATAQDAPIARIEQLAIETRMGTEVFVTEIADTSELRSRGLMFRHRLPLGHAMLFDFKETRPVVMWMKNTHISLDMIFIRSDGTVAGVAENTVPMSEALIESKEPVAFVLEVAAGTAKRIGLRPGDRVVHSLMQQGGG